MPSESIISAVNTPQQSTLVLVVGQRKHLSLIPPHLLPLAELCWRRTTPSTPEDGTELEELEIFSSFLSGILNHPTDQYLDGSSKKALLGWGLGHLQERFLRENDVHVVARGFRSQSQIVGTYFHVVDYLQASRSQKTPKLLAGPSNGLFLQFGGQGVPYLDELRNIYSLYPSSHAFFNLAANVLREEMRNNADLVFYLHGLEFLQWIKGPQSEAPPEEYLMSSPISYPMILITQLAQYKTTAEQLGGISALHQRIKGATGHSQGIAAAVVTACAQTNADFDACASRMVRVAFHTGRRVQMLRGVVLAGEEGADRQHPTPLMVVGNCPRSFLEKHAASVNATLPRPQHVELALFNGPFTTVVSGLPESLRTLKIALSMVQAKEGEDQSRMPYIKRKPQLWTSYLPVSAPFHSQVLLSDAPAAIIADLGQSAEAPWELKFPVFSTRDGSDLREKKDGLLLELLSLQVCQPLHWEKAIERALPTNSVSHILDFGPDTSTAKMTARIKDGTGVMIIAASSLKKNIHPIVLDRSHLFDEVVLPAPNWELEYAPKLAQTRDGKVLVYTPFTKLVGRAPIIIAGMTPTTANEQIVIAFTKAGFHGELAAGGLPRPEIFQNTIRKIAPGDGIHLNMLYLNSKLWGFQFPLVLSLKREGVPIDSITIAAGVPSIEKSNEILAELREHNISFVSFKPDSVTSIRAIIEIAKQNPLSTIVMQWTGGRAGGHHSFEDFHQPILETYSAIRMQSNLVLVAGSGIGEATDCIKYLRGTWSTEFGYPCMPFDGVLLASRIMVAKEALTADPAKELIVATPGVSKETDWTRSYDGEIGGVITVISELGEPIHKLATRGVKLWAAFDKKFFTLPLAQREKAILENKKWIIEGLNKDFQKVYFGKKTNGTVVDLQDMTYYEVLHRMIELMFIASSAQWIHSSFAERLLKILRRTKQRFAPALEISDDERIYTQPTEVVEEFASKFTRIKTQLMTAEDVDYFLHLAREGGKPVNFIPVIDKDLAWWFKKDSLWYSEFIDAVPDCDIQRTCILQGPVAVRHSKIANEPIGDLLGSIHNAIIEHLRPQYPSRDKIPLIDSIVGKKAPRSELSGVIVTRTPATDKQAAVTVFEIEPSFKESVAQWRELLADGRIGTWWDTLLSSPEIVIGHSKVENKVAKIFDPSLGARIEVTYNANSESAREVRVLEGSHEVVRAAFDSVKSWISVTILHHPIGNVVVPFTRYYYFSPQPWAPIHEVNYTTTNVKDFYAKLWFGSVPEKYAEWGIRSTFTGTKTIVRSEVERFCVSIGATPTFTEGTPRKAIAPIDFHIWLCWEPLMKTLFPSVIDADLFNLLHLSYGYKLLSNATLGEDDVASTEVQITEIVNLRSPLGKRVSVKGSLSVGGKPLMEMTSSFLFRGEFTDFENTFRVSQVQKEVFVKEAKDKAILTSKQWFTKESNTDFVVGDYLRFEVETEERSLDGQIVGETTTKGKVYSHTASSTLLKLVGTVSSSVVKAQSDPVCAYLDRHGVSLDNSAFFQDGGYIASPPILEQRPSFAPRENNTYSAASGDYNPIHTNKYIATLCGLPDTITHGMWTAIHARKYLERVFRDQSIASYQAQFVDMVKPQEQLVTTARHIGMKNGRRLVEVKVEAGPARTIVLKATAEVEQSNTAYVFTGQGSAEPRMGMDLYTSSQVAKQLWDRADKHLSAKYGFSILSIVRDNPKELVIHFGGAQGAAIRSNYIALTSEYVVDTPQGPKTQSIPLFPQIHPSATSHTFSHPQGLLFATQFTQPSLTLVEKAAFEDMRSLGLVATTAKFAGHSLGEYAALASIGNVMPIENLVELVFIRGITMQNATRDDEGRISKFGMVAVNPVRVSPAFTAAHLHTVVNLISDKSKKLLQIVNYNVENWQYIVTGHVIALRILDATLTHIQRNPRDVESVPRAIDTLLAENANVDQNQVVLQRGIATIPLPGVDVPFHSRYLLSGVPRFREYLKLTVLVENVDMDLLIGKYVPNLTAKPFEISREYVQEIYNLSNSPILEQVLKVNPWPAELLPAIGVKILIELLAYQFASPVRWIETQDFLFRNNVDRLIEFGPAPTLADMAKRTLASGKYPLFPQKELLAFCRDKDAIYYKNGSTEEQAPATPAAAPTPAPVRAPVAAAPAPVPVAAAAPSAPRAAVADAPVTATEVLQVVLASKLHRQLNEITPDKSIKELVGGKSALQNEIMGDLQKEFGTEPENAAESPLSVLAQAMGANYQKLGSHTQKLIARLVSGKMPAGFGMVNIRAYLAQEYSLGEGRIEGVLLHSLMHNPNERLATEPDAKSWLDKTVASYAQARGIALSGRDAGAGSGGAAAVIDSAALNEMQERHNNLVRRNIKVYAEFLGGNNNSETERGLAERQLREEVERELQQINEEHGKAYLEGVRPLFDVKKERRFDSFWNWARQEAFTLYYDAVNENPEIFGPNYCQRVLGLINRSTPEVLDVVRWIANKAEIDGNIRVANHVKKLAAAMQTHLDLPPFYRILSGLPTAPGVKIADDGRIVYTEGPREDVFDFVDFVEEMCNGFSGKSVAEKKAHPKPKKVPTKATVHLRKHHRHVKKAAPAAPVPPARPYGKKEGSPYLFIGVENKPGSFDKTLTKQYFKGMNTLATDGLTFSGKVCLVTGAGNGSIGLELVKGLIGGGARVIVTTSRFGRAAADMYRDVYQRLGGKHSELILYPFNQGSVQDVNALIEHIYNKETGLGWDIDFVIPFAAINEVGRDISSIDSTSELAHRAMLTNLVRLLGKIKGTKERLGIHTKPTHVVLPLSPNHGQFGGDGLYSESKVGLESLLTRWHSEGWANYLTLAGAIIGWTRGTGLMTSNNLVAEGIEKLGVRTFHQVEMAFSLLALLHPALVVAAQRRPLWADISGGLKEVTDLKVQVDLIRESLFSAAAIKSAIEADARFDRPQPTKPTIEASALPQKANFDLGFPALPTADKLQRLRHMRDVLDLERTIVIVGMGEVGPWGNFRTRWEMEAFGEFSLEGCIEMAWLMGLIKYHNGPLKDGKFYIGWVDAATLTPVPDHEVKSRYEPTILQHAGIRFIEPELFNGYDPNKKVFYHEVVVVNDMEPIDVSSQEEAEYFKAQHGDKAAIFEKNGQWSVQLKRGAVIIVPKALKFDRLVAGQVPTGWNPAAFGIPADIITQVDRVTLFNLVSTAEALMNAGISDPYELYEYIHVSQVGNSTGSGMGGMRALRGIFKDRTSDKIDQADILQETFINTMPAWVNMLLLSSSGPIKAPVGACATAAQSVELGVETILSGKAKLMVVGGLDDFSEEGSYEFAQMKATSSAASELAMGREPSEMSRPTSSTRGGFMESQGAGTQIITTADLALRMGLPIFGIIAMTHTASDKEGRSVPAPGKGLLTSAREVRSDIANPLLDFSYRKERLERELEEINKWVVREVDELKSRGYSAESSAAFAQDQGKLKKKAAYNTWTYNFHSDNDTISPLRGALAAFGLTPDDIGVASFHGTGTEANDLNESEVLHTQLTHLLRRKGDPVLSIFQKSLTGHPKGAAAAWMLNGMCQSLITGIVPGNRNADNVDPALRKFEHIVFNSKSIHTPGLKAGLLKSFGFGQAGAEILIIHPDYLLASLDEATYQGYVVKRQARTDKAYKHFHAVITNKVPLLQVKTTPPYAAQDEKRVYLDPSARASYDDRVGSWQFYPASKPRSGSISTPTPQVDVTQIQRSLATAWEACNPAKPHLSPTIPSSTRLEVTLREVAEGLRHAHDKGIGVDCEDVANIDIHNLNFIERNFTQEEIDYCRRSKTVTEVQAKFTGRWAAKEAVVKALTNVAPTSMPLWKGSAAPLKDIEISPSNSGSPTVVLHGHARSVAQALAVVDVKVTISHCGDYAIAQAVAR